MSTYMRGYKFRIYPTENQKKKIDSLMSFSHAVFNWGLAQELKKFEQYNNGSSKYKFYSYFDLEKLFREERDTNPEKYWFGNYPITTAKYALRNVVNGFKMFFQKKNPGKPKFKKKNKCKKSFNTRNDTFTIKNDKVKFEGVGDYIDLGFDCGLNLTKVINPAVSIDTLGNYYVSFSLEEEKPELNIDIPETEGIGIDLGLVNTMTLSNGIVYNQSNKKLQRIRHRRKRIQRHVTRDQKRRLDESRRTRTKYDDIPKSKNAIKRELKLNNSFKREHNIKNTEYHTFTKQIVNTKPKFVVMETFQVRRIQKENPYLSSKIAQVSFFTITQMMKYKCEKYNIPFIQASPKFPSSQICSCCGHKKKTNQRMFKCPKCGMMLDRDINAAINLRDYGYRFIT